MWAREVGDRDLGMEDRDQLMSPTVNPNRESSYLPEGVFPVRDSGAAERAESSGVQVNVTVTSAASEVSGDGHGSHHHGLDRVPIRLQPVSNAASQAGTWAGLGHAAAERVEARRLEEEEAVASILEEVLASSPELVNNHEANKPPSP